MPCTDGALSAAHSPVPGRGPDLDLRDGHVVVVDRLGRGRRRQGEVRRRLRVLHRRLVNVGPIDVTVGCNE